MRRNFMKGAMLGAMALAGLAGAGQVQSGALSNVVPIRYEATETKKKDRKKVSVNPQTGGLDMPNLYQIDSGTPPKIYGQWLQEQGWYSMAQGKRRSNMNRYAHNAKLSRRKAA